MKKQLVSDLMRSRFYTVTEDTLVSSALRLSISTDNKYFLVTDNGKAIGTVNQDALIRAPKHTMVRDCMRQPVDCIGSTFEAEEALAIMVEKRIDQLTVISNTGVVGVLTRADFGFSETKKDIVLPASN